jgi:hypothetical protein
MVTAVAAVAIVTVLAAGAAAQESSATVRTYQGLTVKLADPSLEVFYTIGEPKERKEESRFQPGIVVTTNAAAGGAAEQAAPSEQEPTLLRGHSQAADLAVWRQGVETRFAWDQVRAMRFARTPVTVASLPPYIPYYRYAVTVSLVDGQQVEADYVNLGATVMRGMAQNGRVAIPWQDVEYLVFDR